VMICLDDTEMWNKRETKNQGELANIGNSLEKWQLDRGMYTMYIGISLQLCRSVQDCSVGWVFTVGKCAAGNGLSSRISWLPVSV